MGMRHRAGVTGTLALGLFLGLFLGLLPTVTPGPASAAARVGSPWATATTQTSITLDWSSRGTTYKIYYATSYRGLAWSTVKSRRASISKAKIKGLRPHTTYCFQLALAGSRGRSQPFCHSTMKHTNKSNATKLGVVTFNVCGSAAGCRGWVGRETAIVRRILSANADVVNLQEVSGRIDRLAKRLTPYGYELGAASSAEAVFYRTSRLTPVKHMVPDCQWQTAAMSPDEVPTWDKHEIYRVEGVVWKYYFRPDEWRGRYQDCSQLKEANVGGGLELRGSATSAWTTLIVNSTGKRYTFMSAHLISGKSNAASRKRAIEASRAVKRMRTLSPGIPVVISGDMNSHRTRPHDSPRVKFMQAGYRDAYDRASSLTNAFMNSYNGWAKRPRRGVRYGGEHIDQIYITDAMGASDWRVIAPLRNGRNANPIASDHNAIRATVWLP